MMPISSVRRFCLTCCLWIMVFEASAQDPGEISISGTLLMLDDATPHTACVVEAVLPASDEYGESTITATALTD